MQDSVTAASEDWGTYVGATEDWADRGEEEPEPSAPAVVKASVRPSGRGADDGETSPNATATRAGKRWRVFLDSPREHSAALTEVKAAVDSVASDVKQLKAHMEQLQAGQGQVLAAMASVLAAMEKGPKKGEEKVEATEKQPSPARTGGLVAGGLRYDAASGMWRAAPNAK